MMALTMARRLCLGSALLLTLTWGIWYGWLLPSDDYGVGLALLGMLPLMVLMPGVLRDRVFATALLGFLSLFYLAHGLMEVVANPDARWLASASTLLSLMLFLSTSHCLRLQRMMRKD